MHPETIKLLVQARQQALLDGARKERLAAIARRQPSAGRPCDSGPAWRRLAGTVVVDFGTWLAGGRIEPVSNLRG